MRRKIYFLFLSATFVLLAGCDQGFKDINASPYVIARLDPPLLLANAERQTDFGSWEVESTIVQQFVNAYNSGATAGPNFNLDADIFNVIKWNNMYPNTINLLFKADSLARLEPGRTNLIAMIRIWKAYAFMMLADTYGDIPYSEAGKGDRNLFFPKYDDDQAIYDDLYKELKEGTDALDPNGEFVSADLFYRSGGKALTQVPQWKKLGNSLLLRLGMRYSKVNPTKAQAIAAEAVSRGVMQSNADDAYILHSSQYPNPQNNGPRTNNPYFYYMAAPFVDFLKTTSDPRAQYIVGKYPDPKAAPSVSPDVTLANQFGFPVGFDSETIKAQAFNRGTAGGSGTGLNYSQLNFNSLGSLEAPSFFVTYSQTKLLMAEAAQRGWITGNPQTLYEDGVRASMDQWKLYPNATAISLSDQNAYLAQPDVAFNSTDALKLINTQYWVSNVGNSPEAWANFRRSGYPALTPNTMNNNLNGGFIRRLPYPNIEALQNADNYNAASTAIGGDALTTRVFWDVP